MRLVSDLGGNLDQDQLHHASIQRRFLQLFAYLRGMVYYCLPCLISLCEAIGDGLLGAVVCGGVSLAVVTIVSPTLVLPTRKIVISHYVLIPTSLPSHFPGAFYRFELM